jgi:hypothetical protein
LERSCLFWKVRPRLGWLFRDEKFRSYFWIGVRAVRGYRVGVFTGGLLVLQAENSTVGLDWQDQPLVRVETTRGNPVSMRHAPHVQGLTAIFNTFVTSCLADQPAVRR